MSTTCDWVAWLFQCRDPTPRCEAAIQLRQTHSTAFPQFAPQGCRHGCNILKFLNPLAIDGIVELLGAKGGLSLPEHRSNLPKFQP